MSWFWFSAKESESAANSEFWFLSLEMTITSNVLRSTAAIVIYFTHFARDGGNMSQSNFAGAVAASIFDAKLSGADDITICFRTFRALQSWGEMRIRNWFYKNINLSNTTFVQCKPAVVLSYILVPAPCPTPP